MVHILKEVNWKGASTLCVYISISLSIQLYYLFNIYTFIRYEICIYPMITKLRCMYHLFVNISDM